MTKKQIMIQLVWVGEMITLIVDRDSHTPQYGLRLQRDAPNLWRMPIPLFQKDLTSLDVYRYLASRGLGSLRLVDVDSGVVVKPSQLVLLHEEEVYELR
jgi:hypothetical protein